MGMSSSSFQKLGCLLTGKVSQYVKTYGLVAPKGAKNISVRPSVSLYGCEVMLEY